MEEKIYEMEYVINGEKYLITATKVENENVNNTLEKEYEDQITTSSVTIDESMLPDNDEPIMVVNVSDIPAGMDIDTWLSIVKEYGIVLMK